MINYDEQANRYARHRQAESLVLARLIDIGRLGERSRVLEVGCGTGNYIGALMAQTGAAGWGLDPSAEMLAAASKRSNRIRYRQGAADHLDFPESSFDFVFSVDMIHHLRDFRPYFAEAYRVLRPGGILCTVTDSADIIRRREPLASYFPETVAVDLARYHRIAQLRQGMIRQGFQSLREAIVTFSDRVTEAGSYRERAFSCLLLISDEAYRRGLARLEQALNESGSIPRVVRYCLLSGART